MNITGLDKNIQKNIYRAIFDNEIALAFSYISDLLAIEQDWEATTQKEEIEMLYKQMLAYELNGIVDPNKASMLNNMKHQLLCITENICEKIKLRTSNSYIYNTKRDIAHKYNINDTKLSIFKDALNENEAYSNNFDYELDKLFNTVAFSNDHKKNTIDKIFSLFTDKSLPEIVKLNVFSAVSIDILSCYNSDIFYAILSLPNTLSKALIARRDVTIVLIVSRYKDRVILDNKNYQLLSQMLEEQCFSANIEDVFIQVVRTYENKTISKKIQEDILPEMMKINSKDIFKVGLDDDDDEFNPNWQESIENSKIEEKIRQFGDLQLSGADVYVSTFAQLKSHQFFNKLSNWFVPFDTRNNNVNSLFNGENNFFKVFSKSPQLCNSDKYSFFLTLTSMPKAQIDMLTASASELTTQMKEETADENWKLQTIEYKQIVKQYIQDLYRFYNLFPNRKDLISPLNEALDLHSSEIYTVLFKNTASRQKIAEFYFDKDCYYHAAKMLSSVAAEIIPDAEFYQKLGYSYFKNNDYDSAITAYINSLTEKPNDKWTLKAIIRCYKQIGDTGSCINYLTKLYELDNNDCNIITSLSNYLYEIGHYDDTIKLLHKLDYLQPNNPITLRKILDVYTHIGDINKAKYYINLIQSKAHITAMLEPSDLINISYISLALNNIENAATALCNIYSLVGRDTKKFYDIAINQDLTSVLNLNIDRIKTLCETVLMFDGSKELIIKNITIY